MCGDSKHHPQETVRQNSTLEVRLELLGDVLGQLASCGVQVGLKGFPVLEEDLVENGLLGAVRGEGDVPAPKG
jgi:hypothetical protein